MKKILIFATLIFLNGCGDIFAPHPDAESVYGVWTTTQTESTASSLRNLWKVAICKFAEWT